MSRQLRRAFVDIVNGWSPISIGSRMVYVRHLTHRDHLNLEDLQEKYLQEAISQGLYDYKSREDQLKKIGLWNDQKERAIFDQKTYIKGMMDGKKNILLQSVLAKVNIQIAEEQSKLEVLEEEKSKLIGFTAEAYASRKCNDHYIMKSIYKDNDFRELLYSSEEFDELEESEMTFIISRYNAIIELCSDASIKKLAIQDFYQSYYYLCNDDFFVFFGRPICDFTFYQIKLANYSKYFKSILEGVDINTLPEKARNDPDELISYLDVRKRGQDVLNSSNSSRVSIVGATKEDLKAIAGSEDEIAKMPNKRMSMQELMRQRK